MTTLTLKRELLRLWEASRTALLAGERRTAADLEEPHCWQS
jgi:hypothetical protein